MARRWAASAAVLLVMAGAVVWAAAPAGATHDDEVLWVLVTVDPGGDDRISITNLYGSSGDAVALVSEVAVALGRPEGSFRTNRDYDGATAVLDDELVVADDQGRLRLPVDTGQLQLLAQRRGYEAAAIALCVPKVRQLVDSVVSPQGLGSSAPGNRCRGWYQLADEPPVRAVLELSPDRHRYSSAVMRTAGGAFCAFGLLGIGATLLRRGPLKRRSVVSWLLSIGSLLGVATVGWIVVSVALWWSGAPADSLLLSGGSGSMHARTMLPGLIFLVPALLPAAVLLTVPRRDRKAGLAAPRLPVAPAAPAWWPTAWWAQWAAQGGGHGGGAHGATGAPQPGPPGYREQAPQDPPPDSMWAPP